MSPLPRPHSATRSLLFAGLAVALTVIAVPSAGATTTISRAGNVLTLTGDGAADQISGAGEHSRTQVTFYAKTDATRLLAGPGCRFLPGRDSGGHRELSCGAIARPANPLTLRATLGGGDDQLQLAWDTDRHPRAIVDGGDGNDKIDGTMLADDLVGGPGDDLIYGWQDRDGLKGGPGQDVLFGGADSDALFGEQGRDNLYGDGVESVSGTSFAGMDVLDATDYPTDLTGVTAEQIAAITPEADQVSCGPGDRDAAVVDSADTVLPSCEGVSGGGRTPITPETTPLFPATMTVTPRSRFSLRASLRGEPIRFLVNSSAGGFVTAKLEISRGDARRFAVPGGRIIAATTTTAVTPQTPAELFMRLSWKARPALSEQRRVTAKLTVSATHGDPTNTSMQTTTRTTTIELR